MEPVLEWLLSGPAWVQYRVRCDLLEQPLDAPEVKTARSTMLADAILRQIIGELSNWPGKVISSHKSANQPFHKLNFLADLGFSANDPGIGHILDQVLSHPAEEGPFQLPMNIGAAHGGSGEDTWAWALCDAPLLIYALAKFDLGGQPPVQKALQYLIGLRRENGWPCAVSPKLGRFRGPGRKDDLCPFANLAMLKVLGQLVEWHDSPEAHCGAETLLELWENRREQHPFIFYMGTDFCKLKAPLIWYDLLHVLDTLSLFPWLYDDLRYQDMLGILQGKADADGRYSPESIYTHWKGWEFAKKREPSRWITFLAYRILKRTQHHRL